MASRAPSQVAQTPGSARSWLMERKGELGVAEWRAKELRRRVGNRRRHAAAVLEGGAESGTAELSLPALLATASRRGAIAHISPPKALVTVPASPDANPGGGQALLLPQLFYAKHEAHEIRMDLFDMQSQHDATLKCCDRQFIVDRNVRYLRSGISAAQLKVRQKTEELDHLQRRILRMSKSLHDTSQEKTFAKTKLLSQEEIRKQQLDAKRCPTCGGDFLPSLLDKHAENCRTSFFSRLPPVVGTNQLTDGVQQLRSAPSPSRFVSQPPRNLRVDEKSISHNSLVLLWDPPIFTGSNPIYDYELRFSLCHSKTRLGEVVRHFEALPPQQTSLWCLRVPIAANQFRVNHLLADQEYGEFSISAITVAGRSQPSNQVDVVRVGPPISPTEPLFLRTGVVTAKSISLSWMEPLDDGGKPIQDYEITFIEAIIKVDSMDERGKGFLDVSKLDYRPRRIRTHSVETTFTITDLLSGTEHKEFQVRAVNTDGIPGDYCDAIKSVFTIAPGNEFKLLDELQAAMNTRTRTVDSQFLSGFMQRYDRQHYIQQVSRFIISMHPEFEDKVNSIVTRSEMVPIIAENHTEQENEAESLQQRARRKRFEDLTEDEKIAERRRQFHFRIAELRGELKKAEYNVQWCKDRQIDLVALIRAAESRILEKQAELERARMFRGPQMDSDVLENGLQRFFTKELVVALEDEIEIDQLYILDTKAEIVKVENYFRADIKRRDTIVKRLEERQVALEAFESNPGYVGEETGAFATLAKLRGGLLYRAFAAFVENRLEAREMRRKMKAAIYRLVHHRLRSAIQRWREVAQALTREASGIETVWGVGSIGLLNAALGRDDLMLEAQELLQQLRSTDASLEEIRWTTAQQSDKLRLGSPGPSGDPRSDRSKQDKKYFPFLLEGDAKMDLQDYEGALRLYNLVFHNSQWMQQMDATQIVQLQLKIGEATFHIKNFEHALTIFSRVSILASRVGLRYEEGSAVLRLADTQFELRSLQMSIESYERALLSFESIGDTKGELACYRGLQHVYEKLDDREMTEINNQQADDIEFALAKKLESAGQQLSKLQLRLVGAGAESSCEITLERVRPIAARLRRERIERKLDIREEVKLAESLEKLLAEKKELLARGEDDLKRALASDSSQVDSDIISGSGARYDLEDFKKKLAKLMGSVKAGEEYINKEIANAKIRVRNAEDAVKDLEEELAVETGALMRMIMSKEKLRCFRFNATNEALKNVVGTASHGITTCFAAAGLDGLLFDFLTGACLAQAVGDPNKNHLGAPTGHQTQILCVYYIGTRVYTGSVEASLGVWDIRDEVIGGFSCSLVKMLTDFDAAVVSVTADTQWVACGSSDCDVFVFDAQSLAIIARIITAHDRTVTTLCLQSANATLTTGAADHRVKVWTFGESSSNTTRRNVKLSWCLEAERHGDEFFNGHLVPVTCVRRTASEIVSGDSGGRIVIWNLDADNKLLRICDVHRDVAVTCLQFDATRIVSGTSSGEICVIDFATGNLIQTLHGHKDSVLDLQFDRTRLISMSADGKLRLWFWQTRAGIGADKNKYHILGAGETLRSLSLKYRTSIQKLLQWNSIPDSTKLYLGQKLIVEVDANATASDELKTLDLASSVVFGKLSYEDLDFVAANQVKSQDVESQWAAQRLTLLAKEYFPALTDDNAGDTTNSTAAGDERDSSSNDDSDAAPNSQKEDNELGGEEQDDGG